MTPSLLSRWRQNSRYNGGKVLPDNPKLSAQEQEIRILRKKLKDSELECEILKKSRRHLLQDRRDKYKFIERYQNLYPVEKMCELLEVSCSGFYYWMSAPESESARKRVALVNQIKAIHASSNVIYGSPRITAELSKTGRSYSRSYIARVMRAGGVRSKLKRRYRATTDSSHSYPLAENLLQRDFSADTLSQKWVSDITYIRTNEG